MSCKVVRRTAAIHERKQRSLMMKLINSRKLCAAWALALFLLIIFAPAQEAFAQEEQGPPQGQADVRPPNPDGDLVRQLNLTPEQIEKIKAIREGNREIRRQ